MSTNRTGIMDKNDFNNKNNLLMLVTNKTWLKDKNKE